MGEDYANMWINKLNEDAYLKKCEIAENKLLIGNNLNANDVYYILKRNYNLFSKDHKTNIDILQRTYKAYNYVCGFTSVILASYARAVMLYFKIEIRTRFISYLFLSVYGIGLFLSMKLFVDRSYTKNFMKYIEKKKDKILSLEYNYCKTPFGENEKKWDPEKQNPTDLFSLE